MGVPAPKIHELRAQLKKNTLPTLLIEGKTDLKVLRSVLRRQGSADFALQPCGGRNEVLELYRDRASFPAGTVAFLADRDFWVVEGVPEEYADLVLTKGYSIENELYADGKVALMALLYPGEEEVLMDLIERVVAWVAHEYNITKSGGGGEFAKNGILDDRVMARKSLEFNPEFLERRGFSSPDEELVAVIRSEDYSGLPGKIIFQAFFKLVHIRRDNEDYTYTTDQLHDQCILQAVSPALEKGRVQTLLNSIRRRFL